MSDQSTEISTETAETLRMFCELCRHIYEGWVIYYGLFDGILVRIENEKDLSETDFFDASYEPCLYRLKEALIYRFFMEIAKLHDPAKDRRGNSNLSIDRIVRQDFWKKDEKDEISNFVSEMNSLFESIKPVRDKILAHNDLETRRNYESTKIFSDKEDERYFENLSKLCKMVWSKIPHENYCDSITVFHFSKSGIEKDSLCPFAEARTLQDLIINDLKNSRIP